MEQDLKDLKKIQAQLDKLRDDKNKLIAATEDKIAKIEEKRLSLRGSRENIMMRLAR